MLCTRRSSTIEATLLVRPTTGNNIRLQNNPVLSQFVEPLTHVAAAAALFMLLLSPAAVVVIAPAANAAASSTVKLYCTLPPPVVTMPPLPSILVGRWVAAAAAEQLFVY